MRKRDIPEERNLGIAHQKMQRIYQPRLKFSEGRGEGMAARKLKPKKEPYNLCKALSA
jgi:hypothetical protein